MYWWDYASVQFVGMLVIGLLCGWAITEARAAGALNRRRIRRNPAGRALGRHLADLAALEARLSATLRRLEALEKRRADDASIIRLAPQRPALLDRRGGEAA